MGVAVCAQLYTLAGAPLNSLWRIVTNQMSDFTCQCTDTMVATCTSSFASAYLCAAVVAIAVVLARVCTCDWSDDSDSSDDDENNDAVRSMFS